jgi:hypothetical protein
MIIFFIGLFNYPKSVCNAQSKKKFLRGPRSKLPEPILICYQGGTCCLETQFCDLLSDTCIDHEPGLKLNKEIAHKFVVYSFISYCLPGLNLTSWDCYWCRDVPKVDIMATASSVEEDSYAYVGLNVAEKLIVVSFRGTCDYDNIMTDTNFIKTRPYPDWPSLEVHQGFYNSYSSISTTIIKGVMDVSHNAFVVNAIVIVGTR